MKANETCSLLFPVPLVLPVSGGFNSFSTSIGSSGELKKMIKPSLQWQ